MSEVKLLNNRQRIVQLTALAICAFSASYSRYSLGPLQEDIGHNLHLSDNTVALLQGAAFALPVAIGAVPLGLMIDRRARRPLFLIFTLLNLAAFVVAALSPNLVSLFLARFATGCSFAALITAAYACVPDLYPPERRGSATMLVCIGEVIGAPVAFALGGLLSSLMTSLVGHLGIASWRLTLLAMATPLIPLSTALLAMRELRRTPKGSAEMALRVALATLWDLRGVVIPIMIARIMVWIADGSVVVWGLPAFVRAFRLPPAYVSEVMAIVLLIYGVGGPFLGGPLADICYRWGGPRRTIVVLSLLALISAAAGLFPVVTTFQGASLVMTLFLLLGCTIGVSAHSLGTVVVPKNVMGVFMATVVAVGALFSIGVAPLSVSLLSGAIGGPTHIPEALATVCVVSSLLGAGVFWFGRKRFPGREEIAAADSHFGQAVTP